MSFFSQALEINVVNELFSPPALGPGYGLPAAIGSCLGNNATRWSW